MELSFGGARRDRRMARDMWGGRTPLAVIFAAQVATWLGGCGGGSADPEWEIFTDSEPGALLSVWGPSAHDVWAVGADSRDGLGPTVLRIQNGAMERLETGETSGDLWWVFGFAEGPVFMGGSGGVILRYENGTFTKMTTPGSDTVFGIWGASPTDMWAVGGASDAGGGFAWRLDRDAWAPEPALPAEVPETGALWKVHGTGPHDAWLVGSSGMSFHWNGETLEPGATGVGSSLFTVFGNAEHYAAVGGLASGIIVENAGEGWINVTPDPLPVSLTGVALAPGGGGFAVGLYGAVYERKRSSWVPTELGLGLDENLHGVWVAPDGEVWAAGGNTLGPVLTAGILIHRSSF